MAILLPNGMCAPRVSYHPNDLLAEIIARAWTDPKFKKELLNSTKKTLAKKGIFIDYPVVIEEAEHDDGYRMTREEEVVFVLPDKPDKGPGKAIGLLETARIQMAFTPCGI